MAEKPNSASQNNGGQTELAHGNIAAVELMRKINEIQELPTLSTVFAQVLSLLQDPDTSAEELAKVIECDQAMVPKLLKLVNSAFFGFPERVSSIQHAIMLLGFGTVRNAVMSVEVINAFALRKKIRDFDIAKFWEHAITVAIISRYLDNQTGKHYSDDVFAAGLIHDIGKIVLAYYFADRFETTWNCMLKEKITFWDAEKRFFPIDHALVGSQLAAQWNLPERFQHVVANHHSVSKKEKDHHLVLIVHTADALANQLADEQWSPVTPPICLDARDYLEELVDSAEQWMPLLKDEILSACDVLLP